MEEAWGEGSGSPLPPVSCGLRMRGGQFWQLLTVEDRGHRASQSWGLSGLPRQPGDARGALVPRRECGGAASLGL